MNLNIRISDEQHEKIKQLSVKNGFESVSAYVKYVSLNAKVIATVPKVGSKK